ncbi:MAG: hypothetical protein ABSH49_13065 [Bryobacteraceae bacterium]|jgi:hypothetical protein
MSFSPNPAGGVPDAEEMRRAVAAFLANARQPALLEPGEELLAIGAENFHLEARPRGLCLEAWDRTRNLTRRVTAIKASAPGRLELAVERFAKREGSVYLLDLARRSGADMGRRSGRLVFRERFRLFLRRQFPSWTLAELSAEPNLEFSLSPVFPRALLRSGRQGWAAIACPPEADAAALVSFGLIWLAYLRARERRAKVEGLALYVPTGAERAPALRLLCLNPEAARVELFGYTEQDSVLPVDPRDHGNLDTRVEVCRRAAEPSAAWQRIAAIAGVERVAKHDGRVSLRVRGLEFAECADGKWRFGLGIGESQRQAASERHLAEIERLAEELIRARTPGSDSRHHPLYRQSPEAWLESQARANLAALDASLLPQPVYGQVPAFAGGERGLMDLVAADARGRLAVIELKASADLHLPLQALDYWIRVKWHLDRGEFSARGYFPALTLSPEPPRLLLVAPALEFHPTTETILGFFDPRIEVERIGVSEDWRSELRVMFRLKGAESPKF